MKTKLIKIGNSTGVIIPKKLLDELGLKPGKNVWIEKDQEAKGLRLADAGIKSSKSSVTPEFLKMLDEINDKYDKALKKLAEL